MELSKKKLWNFDYQGSSKNDLSSDLKVPMLGVNKIVFHERCLGTVLPWFAYSDSGKFLHQGGL